MPDVTIQKSAVISEETASALILHNNKSEAFLDSQNLLLAYKDSDKHTIPNK